MLNRSQKNFWKKFFLPLQNWPRYLASGLGGGLLWVPVLEPKLSWAQQQPALPPALPLPSVPPRPGIDPLPAPVLPPPEQLLLDPKLQPGLPPVPAVPETAGRISVARFEVVGSTVFSAAELAALTAPFLNRPLSFQELWQVAEVITQRYQALGYVTSGAFVPAGQTFAAVDGTVKIQVSEGYLKDIQVTGTGRLSPSYVRRRLRLASRGPLNINRLVEALRLLQLNPLFRTITAELEQGSLPGTSLLRVQAVLAPTFSAELDLDNQQTPSAGSWRRSLQLRHANLAGQGDEIALGYTNSVGSNAISFSYTYPINARNGTLSLQFQPQWNAIIEPPFNQLDIQGQATELSLSYRQPILQTPQREFALGLSLARKQSQNRLAGIPFPLSPGADSDGMTRLNLLRFSQDYLQRNPQQVIAGRSQLTFGMSDGPIEPFAAWLGQAQWVRQWAPDSLVLVRANLQLSNRPLVPLEQLSLTGAETVRGYRQNLILASSGAILNAEARIALVRVPKVQGLLQFTPFFDLGHRFDRVEDPFPSTVATLGVGVRWQMWRRLLLGVDYGVPLIAVPSAGNTLQDKGLRFFMNLRVY
jgi:hemolysin activation/secretion protein